MKNLKSLARLYMPIENQIGFVCEQSLKFTSFLNTQLWQIMYIHPSIALWYKLCVHFQMCVGGS